MSTKKAADALDAAVAPLREVMQGMLVDERENEAALTARDRAIAEWAIIYQGVANMLSGLYRLAGRDDLADRIRPTVRRAEGLDQPPAEPEPIVGGGDTDPAADPTGDA